MKRNTVDLRDFEEHDWDGYAGCESASPKMAGVTLLYRHNIKTKTEKYEGCFIVDGKTVFIDVMNVAETRAMNFTYEFLNEKEALDWVDRLNEAFTFTTGYLDGNLLVSHWDFNSEEVHVF